MCADKPLAGLKIVEIASIGPGPFAAMMFADHGADVVRVDRPGGAGVGFTDALGRVDPTQRGRRTTLLDLKSDAGRETALQLIERADALIEGYRPGVMERLGLGPDVCMARHPALVYARMTGWGQSGPLSERAGHDINYIALTGALDAIGTTDSGPVPPLNLIGDYGGGGMLLAFGVVSGVLQARLSGKGTVVDAAMVDGTAQLMALPFGLKSAGLWGGARGDNLLDGGAPFYGTFRTSDDKWIALGPIEMPFWTRLRDLLQLEDAIFSKRDDRRFWSEIRELIAARIATKTREEWTALLEPTDVCYAPVLTMDEAPQHPHNKAREIFQTVNGIVHPAPAPRFGEGIPQAAAIDMTPVAAEEILREWE